MFSEILGIISNNSNSNNLDKKQDLDVQPPLPLNTKIFYHLVHFDGFSYSTQEINLTISIHQHHITTKPQHKKIFESLTCGP